MDARPDVVLCDADGVLQAATEGWHEALRALGSEEFIADLFAAEDPCLSGEVAFEEAVRGVIERHHLPVTATQVMAPWARIDVDEEALRLVDDVRAGGRACYLATNQHDFRRDVMRARLPYSSRLDGSFYSCELGAAKPDEGYFTRVLHRLGTSPDQVLFIDDSPRNVTGAARCGLRAELHDPRAGAAGLRRILERHGLP